jgi:hypothetical protein
MVKSFLYNSISLVICNNVKKQNLREQNINKIVQPGNIDGIIFVQDQDGLTKICKIWKLNFD